MTPPPLNTLLAGIGVAHVLAFFLVLARITPLFVVAPAFSSPLLMGRVRSVLAVGLAFGMTPLAAHSQHLDTSLLAVLGLLAENFLVGFALAFAICCVFAAIEVAGGFADLLSGFSFGQVVDPVNGNPGGTLMNLYTVVGLVLFLVIGGDAWMMRGLAATFNAIPLGSDVLAKPLVASAEAALGAMFVGAVEIAAPLILALLVTDVAFGVVSRVMPQLNVFAVGFPAKVGVGLIVVGVSLPFLGPWMSGQLQGSVASAIGVLHA